MGDAMGSVRMLSDWCRLNAFFHPASESLRLDRSLQTSSAPWSGVFLVRDDRLHPMIAGNKWWKLNRPLPRCNRGAYANCGLSNHVLAVAAAGHLFGFRTWWVDSGRRGAHFESGFVEAKTWGMELKPARDHYRALLRHRSEDPWFNRVNSSFRGGRGSLAMQG